MKTFRQRERAEMTMTTESISNNFFCKHARWKQKMWNISLYSSGFRHLRVVKTVVNRKKFDVKHFSMKIYSRSLQHRCWCESLQSSFVIANFLSTINTWFVILMVWTEVVYLRWNKSQDVGNFLNRQWFYQKAATNQSNCKETLKSLSLRHPLQSSRPLIIRHCNLLIRDSEREF